MTEIQWIIVASRERAPQVYAQVWKLKRLGINPEVVWDEHREGAWWNRRKAYQRIESEWAMVIEDDLYIPESGPENVRRILRDGSPECMVSMCWIGKTKEYRDRFNEWMESGVRYVRTTKVDGPATLVAKWAAEEQTRFSDIYIDDSVKHAAPDRASWWLELTGWRAYHVVPSVFEHVGTEKSMCGTATKGRNLQVVALTTDVLEWERTEQNTAEWYYPYGIKNAKGKFKPGMFEEALARYSDTVRKV